MAIIPVGFGQVNFFFTGAGYARGAQVVMGFSNDGPSGALGAAEAFAENWVTNILPEQATDITLDQVKVKLGPNDTGDEAVSSVGEAGTNAGQGYSPQVAALITKVTLLGGREGRGRIFFPGLLEASTDGLGKLTAATKNSLDVAFASFKLQASDDDLPIFLLHNSATAPTALEGFDTVQLLATQRRRIRKVGGRRAVA